MSAKRILYRCGKYSVFINSLGIESAFEKFHLAKLLSGLREEIKID